MHIITRNIEMAYELFFLRFFFMVFISPSNAHLNLWICECDVNLSISPFENEDERLSGGRGNGNIGFGLHSVAK